MSRAERRKTGAPKERTYTLTESQIEKIRQEAMEEAMDRSVDVAFTLMLAIPLEVLIGDGYWPKTAKKRLPKFLDEVLSLYDSYNAGVLTLEELREDLYKYGGIEIQVNKAVEHF